MGELFINYYAPILHYVNLMLLSLLLISLLFFFSLISFKSTDEDATVVYSCNVEFVNLYIHPSNFVQIFFRKYRTI